MQGLGLYPQDQKVKEGKEPLSATGIARQASPYQRQLKEYLYTETAHTAQAPTSCQLAYKLLKLHSSAYRLHCWATRWSFCYAKPQHGGPSATSFVLLSRSRSGWKAELRNTHQPCLALPGTAWDDTAKVSGRVVTGIPARPDPCLVSCAQLCKGSCWDHLG